MFILIHNVVSWLWKLLSVYFVVNLTNHGLKGKPMSLRSSINMEMSAYVNLTVIDFFQECSQGELREVWSERFWGQDVVDFFNLFG